MRAHDPSLASHRHLRIGMVGAVVLLATSIGLERLLVTCWQTSISGYYYTPVRAILVGALMAIGLSLVVVAGRTEPEDALLNVAGMLAPVVALVPTTEVVTCWSAEPARFPVDEDSFAAFFRTAITNNMGALLVTGALALLLTAVLGSASRGGPRVAMQSLQPGSRWGLYAAVALVGVTAAGLRWWSGFDTHAHDIAAVAMFACLVAVVWSNARSAARTGQESYRTAYRVIAVAMVVPALLLVPAFERFGHRVFVVEAVEVGLFAVFWVLQTRQSWHHEAGVGEVR